MRDKIRGRAEWTSAHGSYYNFLGKKVEKQRCTVLFWLLIFWAWCVGVIVRYFNEHFDSIFPKINSGADTSSYNWHTTPYGYDILKKQRAWKNISHQKANQNRFRALSDLFFSLLLHNAILSQKCGLSVVTQKWMVNWHHFFNLRKESLPFRHVWYSWSKTFTFKTLKWVQIWNRFSFPITDTVIIKHCGFWKDETILLSLKRFSPWLLEWQLSQQKKFPKICRMFNTNNSITDGPLYLYTIAVWYTSGSSVVSSLISVLLLMDNANISKSSLQCNGLNF